MYNISVDFAGFKITLSLIYEQNQNRLVDFITHENPSVLYKSSHNRIELERDVINNNLPLNKYEDIQLEYNSLYRDLSEILFDEGILIFHGVLVEMNNEGYLFTAKSRVGKSTHAQLWEKAFPGQARIINGDKPFLKIKSDGLYAYGSPWKGKENIGYNGFIKVKAICHMRQDSKNTIKQIEDIGDALKWFINQSMLKGRNENLPKLIKWFKCMYPLVSFYELDCNMDINAAYVAFEGMK